MAGTCLAVSWLVVLRLCISKQGIRFIVGESSRLQGWGCTIRAAVERKAALSTRGEGGEATVPILSP